MNDIDDPVLGLLRYNPTVGWFEVRINLDGGSFKLALLPDDPNDVGRTLMHGRHYMTNIRDFSKRARKSIIESLLPVKNERFLKGDEEPMSRLSFSEALVLESIVVDTAGHAEMYFDADDLFDGRTVLAELEPDGTVTTTDIAG